MTQSVCWINGTIMPLAQAAVPVMDHGLLYGDGVFEGIRYYCKKPFLLQPHLQRLLDSAHAIALDYPWTMSELNGIINDTIAASGLENGYLRVIITRGEGPLGIDPQHCKTPRLIVIASALNMLTESIRKQGASIIIAATRRLPADGLDPRIKSLNYLNHILARMEATRSHADEAVLLNHQGHVTEGSADNIFIVKNNDLLTPPVTDGALDGITRKLIMELADSQAISVLETTLSAYDLYTADECFLSGTGAELIAVRCIDARPLAYCPGAVFKRLEAAFQQFIRHDCKKI